ncbi:MAG: hypothetical protein ACFE9L_13670 [Candidatus Hodarchaeota archaeon]
MRCVDRDRISFSYNALLYKIQPIKDKVVSKPVKKVTNKPIIPIYTVEKKLSLDEYINKYESVIKTKLQLFEGHVIRHDQKNPISWIGVDIAYLSFDPQFFKKLYELGYLEKTNYSGQWRIK